jgi:3-hydroxybutyryl-CoA dehydrogenase
MSAAADGIIAVVGTGVMGEGIAQVAARGGLVTLLFDAREGAAARARDAVAGRLWRLVEKDRLTADEATAAIDRLRPVAGLEDLAAAEVVIEAVVEDLETKRRLFAELERIVGPTAVLASNTSSIPIGAIARACTRRERVAGLHFFNPVPLMRLVEVVRAADTGEATVERLVALAERLARTPVVVKDGPGFLVNLGGRALTTEGLRILQEGVATPERIDAIVRDQLGLRMGPFELMDLTGLDVNYPVTRLIHEGYGHDRRLATTPDHAALFEAGRLGRKTGRGWYAYGEGASPPSPDDVPDGAPARRVALARATPDLLAFCAEAGLEVAADDGRMPILAAPVGDDATHTALATRADFRRLVCVDLLGDTHRRVTLMTAPGAAREHRDGVAAAFVARGRAVTAIGDSPGFVAQRIASMIVDLGCFMAETGLAAPADIDRAMRLGLNYPEGPLELGDRLGPATCLHVLERLQALIGDDRYRPTLWLRPRARLGLSLLTPA